MGIRGASDLAEYICTHYSGRVVEVGAGYVSDVALTLNFRGLDVAATDKEERFLDGLHVEKDDIFSPRLELYEDACLIYSLRPPLEMQIAIGDLACRIGADILIRPLGDEVAQLPGFVRRLANAGEARFYLFELRSS
jgi:uncharacterized protein